MNKRRLLKLADMLEADAKNKTGIKFDLNIVGRSHFPNKATLDCGTSACAMGLAGISGAFKRGGLSYKVRCGRVDLTINGRRTNYKTAAKSTFGISIPEAQFLFSSLKYPCDSLTGAKGERVVAKRIRDFVAGKVAPT